MAVKFSDSIYWNPSEWVSRTLFRDIESLPRITSTHYESEIKEKLQHQIKLYVWLLDFNESEPYELQIFKELVESSNDQIEIKEEFRKSYFERVSELLDHLKVQIQKKSNHSNWNYIKGWNNGSKITTSQLEEWAYSENGIFQDQDEDLLMYNPELIKPMFKLLGTKWCKRNSDLGKTLLNYYINNKAKRNDLNADKEFIDILRAENLNDEQIELINKLKSS